MSVRRLGIAWLVAAMAAGLPAMAIAQAPAQPAIHGGAPAVSPDGSRIAFLSDRDGATDLYVVSADGTGERRLTHTLEKEGAPDWSADGKSIRFSVFADDSSRIYSIDAGGGTPRLLGSVPGRAMRVAPDGRRVLYWTGTWTAMKLFVSGLDGAGARQLTDGSGVVWGARWSPDGKRIAFADRDANRILQVYVIDADGSGRRQVTRFAAADGSAQMPAWSSEGSRLAVQSGAPDVPAHIWIVDASTGTAKKLGPHDERYRDEVPAWFPGRDRIAFQSDRTGRMEIWVMDADGSSARQVTR